MAAKGEKHILRAGATDKRAKTVILCESWWLHATIQAHLHWENREIFTRLYFSWCLAFKQKHWSNETKTIHLIDLLIPYIEKVKEEKADLNFADLH